MPEGIAIGRLAVAAVDRFATVAEIHRDDYYVICLLEEGTVSLVLDFEEYKVSAPALVYIHPGQVHHLGDIRKGLITVLLMGQEQLYPEYLTLLADIGRVRPLSLSKAAFKLFDEAARLCLHVFENVRGPLYHSLLRNSCNTLVALAGAQYQNASSEPADLSRAEVILKAFCKALEQDFLSSKRPADYAHKLNLSVSYLNECVKDLTGYPVSHHIQQRIVLEAKRLLYYSDQSVKEIAAAMGYDDYPYFSRLFRKVTGMTPLAFRHKNRD
jgi:AraC-like DNA-binding protein